ncbi:hypothetical protein PINS_up010223 [Pythium insidiosum]|nr:hypothetical protein PINS_up010223 [Pythium insidiosum]
MNEPDEVKDEPSAGGTPVVLLTSANASLNDVQLQLRQTLQPRVREFFPEVTLQDLEQQLQVAYRTCEQTPWVALQDAVTLADDDSNSQVMIADACVADLRLEERDFKDGNERFHHLLIEGRYRLLPDEAADNPNVAWKNGRFYSDVLSNQWRFELEKGQLIDALDTDKKWYVRRQEVLRVEECIH